MYEIFVKLPHRNVFHIMSDTYGIIFEIEKMYGIYTSVKESYDEQAALITITKNNNSYFVSYLERKILTDTPIVSINGILIHETKYSDKVLALHGAAVEYKSKAYVFLAGTTTGKTTLTSYLTANGFGYITDDCILIDKESHHIHPCTTPLHLRLGGVAVLKKNNITLDEYNVLNGSSINRFVYTPKNCIINPLPIKRIFFIERTDENNQLKSIEKPERISELLKSPICPYNITSAFLKDIARLSFIDMNKLQYSDMSYVATAIKNTTH